MFSENKIRIVSYLVTTVSFVCIIYKLYSLDRDQENLRIENARLSGIAEAHSATLVDHKSRLDESEDRIKKSEESIIKQDEKISEHDEKLVKHEKDIKSVKRKVQQIVETPPANVVIAATDDQARKKAFDNWAVHHPDWKARRSCMKHKMTENNSISLTDAYNSCE